MDRRGFLGTLAGGLLAAPLTGEAQAAGKVVRIGVLELGSELTSGPQEAFRQGLRELGYVEGQNVVLEYRFAEGRAERLPDFAAELVRLRMDVIVAGGTPAPLAAKHATGTIPIVMSSAGDPVGTGLVASLAKPGGNVTGLSLRSPELTGKRLQLTKEVVPGLSRVAVLWNAANPIAALVVRETEDAARTLGVQVQSLEVRGPDDFENALPATVSGGAGALFVVDDPLVFRYRGRIADFAVRNRLPATAFYKAFAEAGGLMTLGPSLADLYRRAAIFVDKILKGAKPGDLPVEQPTKFELVINLKTAKALGLTIPPSLLQRADQV
ncbi:MAG TPA: ABC transporter substrate-binding protein, partial [Planctomycetota bacterium]|nr:ABC transporter substrate-binding protein [Planctomycetota bacterium]